MFPNKVIVLGGNHHNTLGVIRSLGEKGISPYVILTHSLRSFVSKSKYIKKSYYINDEYECIKILQNYFYKEKNKSIIICCSDRFSSIIDLNYNKLKDYFYLPNANKEGEINRLMNKDIMSGIAKSCGFQIIPSWVITKNINNIPSDIIYPCITKPLYSIKGTKATIKVCNNRLEVENVFDFYGESGIQIQKFIDKEIELQLFGCSLNGGKTVIIPGFSKIIRSTQVTNTGFLELIPISDFDSKLTEIRTFLQKIQYSGLFSLELLKDRNGAIYFMEINFRNDGNAYSVTSAGVNLPYIWCLGNIGNSLFDEPLEFKKNIYVMPVLVDIWQVVNNNITLEAWLNDLRKTDCFLHYNRKDIKPFYMPFKNTLRGIVRAIIKKYYLKFMTVVSETTWDIGFVDFDENKFLEQDNFEIKYLKYNGKQRWFADPFILEKTQNEIILLVEEFSKKIGRGRIAKLIIDRSTYKLKSEKIILDIPTHLSFPAIYKDGKDIYLYPENSKSGECWLYKYNPIDDSCIKKNLLINSPVKDSIIFKFNEIPFIFTTSGPYGNKNRIDIYTSDSWNTKYEHVDSVFLDNNSARSAGYLFKLGDKIIRPAQDCNSIYGGGLIFQEVKYEKGHFSFKEIKKTYPNNKRYIGMHTFNKYNDNVVLDFKRYKYPILLGLTNGLKKSIKKVII